MALNEFSLIQQYFSSLGKAPGVALGVGDDCAVLDVPEGEQLVVTVDTLVAGIHFPLDASPGDIAHRALRVNLSDIAAMAAQPRWFTLALTLRSNQPMGQGFQISNNRNSKNPANIQYQVHGIAVIANQ